MYGLEYFTDNLSDLSVVDGFMTKLKDGLKMALQLEQNGKISQMIGLALIVAFQKLILKW